MISDKVNPLAFISETQESLEYSSFSFVGKVKYWLEFPRYYLEYLRK